MTRVSVIMNCLNGEKYLDEALDSLRHQTFKDFEIIFWDNGSSDRSAEIAQNFGGPLKYFCAESLGTLGQGRNNAFSVASGEYLAILDVDDVWLPQKLEKQVALMDSNPELGFSFTNTIFFNEDGDLFDLFSVNRPARGMIFEDILKTGSSYISSETTMFRKSFLQEFKPLFNDAYTMVMDMEVMLKLANKYPTDYVDEVLSKWRAHPESETSKNPVRTVDESRLMLKDLKASYPEIEKSYSDALANFELSQDHILMMDYWKKGKRLDSLKIVLPHAFRLKYLFYMIAIALFPYSMLELVKSSMMKLRKA